MARIKSADASIHPNGWVAYPVPLGKDRWARLLLPGDLTNADVDRIVAYITTLVLEPETT